ncbi:hypothetical protein [Gaoshiqia sediminis]|uniref:Uncharacterized protein n=1 Tax=Gaoshiqia sediminis TaxID=2986998 RepID=A0AA42C6U6_9BACT|nr:hypothetical protein [Gaoshiqia sediminis]MCW0484308.1 hypothetical protein [Gaoshiqia sediminis]
MADILTLPGAVSGIFSGVPGCGAIFKLIFKIITYFSESRFGVLIVFNNLSAGRLIG